MAFKTKYSESLKNPLWQRKRLEIMQRDDFKCMYCLRRDAPLTVHHKYYEKDKKAWEYPDDCYVTLCEQHHIMFHKEFEQRMYNQNDQSYLMGRIWNINYTDMFLLYGWIDQIIFHERQKGFKKIIESIKPLMHYHSEHLQSDE